ncbi:uncharacterized protein LOC121384640 isoform X2 [Gigantopelta aegis]|uniref:uncharacterized protein LOC121384640 isoform X2 n=1 Tax=Gigantopelta aegis TaxID=1735272 RepID=UPI001B88C41A|nr:uncharacterized protein LOC121384640 isoform X2 [Gigantopelta aegis]
MSATDVPACNMPTARSRCTFVRRGIEAGDGGSSKTRYLKSGHHWLLFTFNEYTNGLENLTSCRPYVHKSKPRAVNNLPLNITFGEETAEDQRLREVRESNTRVTGVESSSLARQRMSAPTGSQLELTNEQRTNKYLVIMTILFAVLWLPFLTFFTTTWSADGPYPIEREDYKDVLNVVFLVLGFLSSVFVPVVFSLWQMSTERKQKIKSVFRFPKWRKNRAGQ